MKEKSSRTKDLDYVKACLLFVALIGILDFTVFSLHDRHWMDPFINFTTVVSAFFINLIGIDAVRDAQLITLPNRTLKITLECTAIFIIVLYAALIIVYPSKLKKKLSALGIGVPILIAANIIRLVVIAAVSEVAPYYFDYMHDYLWQVSFIMITAVLWLMLLARGETN